MSRVFMLKPADGIEGVKEAILTAVKDAGPNACPPMVVGVGIGGTFEKCAYLAKKALTRDLNEESPVEYVRDLEKEMLEKINKLGIGPYGTWRNSDSTCNQYRDISYTYCRASGSSKHLLSCKQTFTQGNIIREANHG